MRFRTCAGTTGSSALRMATFDWLRVIFWLIGICRATSNTSLSRKGTRNSSELAMVTLSAFTKMSPRSRVNRSRCCIRATGSQPRDSS